MKNKGLLIIILSVWSLYNSIGQERKKLDSLWNNFNQAKHDTTRIKTYLDIGDVYEHVIPDTALFFYGKAVDLADKALGTTPPNHIKLNSNAVEYKIFAFKATSLRYIGVVHRNQGSYDKAVEYYRKALKIFEELGDKKGLSSCYTNIGAIHYYQGSYDSAIAYYLKSLKIYEGLEDKNGMSSCYNNIGAVHYYQGSYDKAIVYYLKSLKIFEELGDKNGMSSGYTNIGAINYYQGNYDKALEYYLKSLKIYEELGDKNGMSSCYNNIGATHRIQGCYNKAIGYYLKALKIFEELGDKSGMSMVYNNIASLHIALADSAMQQKESGGWFRSHLDTALEYGNKAFDLAIEIGAVPIQNDAAEYLQNAYTKLGKYEQAIKYAEIFIETQNSMFSEEKTKALAEMGTKYETEKKQLHIENLEKDNNLKKLEIQKQKILIFSFIICFVIILVFLGLIFRLFVQKKKANILLALKNAEVEQKNEEITAQRDEIETQRNEITKHRDLVVSQKEEIEASINYAKRIQRAVLPPEEHLQMFLGNSFILFRPKDIVSGDFYWATLIKNWQIVTVADCTGHGVPGAFMSMLGVSFLNEIIRKQEITKASDILNHLRKSVIESLKQTGASSTSTAGSTKDGMDLSLCVINIENNSLQWAGANNPLWIVKKIKVESHAYQQAGQKGIEANIETLSTIGTLSTFELYELKGDKMPIAIYERMDDFTNHELQLTSGDQLYMMSDGYEDQFGGPKHKKFLSKNLKQLLIENCRLNMNEQKGMLEKTLVDWIGNGEQIDDITILGIKF